jgi:acylphosphatase
MHGMTARHLIISGLVQGIGYRDWLVATARQLGLSGWVRNRTDGTVEALLAGEVDAVEECLRACRRGPRLAMVESITETLAEPPEETGFVKRPTA